MRAKLINELAGFEDKNPHENFLKAKEILLSEIGDIVDLNAQFNKIKEELIYILEKNNRGEEFDESTWQKVFMDEYLIPIENHLKELQGIAHKLEAIEEVGDIYNDLEPKKKSFIDRFKNIKI